MSIISLPVEQSPLEEPSSLIGIKKLGLAASFVTPSPKKSDGGGSQFIEGSHQAQWLKKQT
jgi:hypothetical protein